ncbi:unnamed protein product [Rangifer tarandus platyrhynchus]|uniref:Uncharacterized protein n=1 Tax=Rangifer tarandus platyrhynchus TaxID=3082113 RepID=A0ABN8YZ81_RANTA|nr:unnamed protein product [Rangifer tarandus platyrhynchus]
MEAWVAEPSTTVGRKPALPPRLPGPQVGVEGQSRRIYCTVSRQTPRRRHCSQPGLTERPPLSTHRERSTRADTPRTPISAPAPRPLPGRVPGTVSALLTGGRGCACLLPSLPGSSVGLVNRVRDQGPSSSPEIHVGAATAPNQCPSGESGKIRCLRHCRSPKESRGESSYRPRPPPDPAHRPPFLSTGRVPSAGTPGAAVTGLAGLAPRRGHQEHPGDMVVRGLTLSPRALLGNKGRKHTRTEMGLCPLPLGGQGSSD